MIVRAFNLLDRLDAAPELQMLMDSVAGSVRTLICSMAVLFILTFLGGVPLTAMVSTYRRRNPDNTEAIAEL